MKRFLVLSFVILLIFLVNGEPSPAYAVIAWVSQASSSAQGTDLSSISKSITGLTIGNNLAVSCGTYKSGGPTVNTATDTSSGIWTKDIIGTTGSQNQSIAIFSSVNIGYTTTTVSCTGSGGTGGQIEYWNMFINEYSGMSTVTSTFIDASSTVSNASSATCNPGAITTTNANDVIVSSCVINIAGASTLTTAPGFTLRGDNAGASPGGQPGDYLDRVVSATGSYNGTSTFATAGGNIAVQVAYKAAPAAAATGPTTHLFCGLGQTRNSARSHC